MQTEQQALLVGELRGRVLECVEDLQSCCLSASLPQRFLKIQIPLSSLGGRLFLEIEVIPKQFGVPPNKRTRKWHTYEQFLVDI